ncbi:MAG: hypothetical protein Greene041619_1002 [Candidatus Peregrinibacteria bacterium Greene0416_19]|nr:MAG: hypothetical protein Greene041619_1002 [Candidatus Peregrinibacteria bacterium Greene0416_19]
MAMLYLKRGENGNALDALKNALKIDPKHESAKALLQEMIRQGIVGQK